MIDAATLEAALCELDADSLDHLGFLLRERAARQRCEERQPKAQPPVPSIYVPAQSIWEWVVVDMVIISGYPWRLAAEVVADLAREVDHLPDQVVVDLLARARAQLCEGAST